MQFTIKILLVILVILAFPSKRTKMESTSIDVNGIITKFVEHSFEESGEISMLCTVKMKRGRKTLE